MDDEVPGAPGPAERRLGELPHLTWLAVEFSVTASAPAHFTPFKVRLRTTDVPFSLTVLRA